MISLILFAIALTGWAYMVFANHFTWIERRKQLCSIGEHWLTKESGQFHNKQGQYFVEQHCRACAYMKVKEVDPL